MTIYICNFLLLSNVDKIIDKLMHKRVMQCLMSNAMSSFLYQKQFGFQKKKKSQLMQ